MSAGVFIRSKYELDNGAVVAIKIQPETISLGNPVPPGAITQSGSARVGGGNRRIGIKARSVTGRWTGTAPAGYKQDALVRVPILSKAPYDQFALGATLPYQGTSIEIVGKNPERVR